MRDARNRSRPRTRALAAAAILAGLLTAGLAGAASAQADDPAEAVPGTAEDGPLCVARYHAALGRIAAGEYQAVKAAGAASATGDERLPGTLLFPPIATGKRTKEETAALVLAASLARSKGRAGWGGDMDARWMADRLRVSLSDYLTQGPSPYLCGGVAAYVATLRGFAERLGPTPARREALAVAARGGAGRAIDAAFAAMRAAPGPRFAPADRPGDELAAALRPTAGLDRSEPDAAAGTNAGVDPDLPPLTAQSPAALDSIPELVAAIDRLTDAAGSAGFVTGAPNAMPVGGGLAVSAATHPVLARLALARPLVFGARPRIANRSVRLRLAAAFSSIETLDYLMRSSSEGADPLASAIDATFEAILKAHAADCTCRE